MPRGVELTETGTLLLEVNQPLAAIVANGTAAIRWLSNTPPDINEALAGLRSVVRDGHRASEIIAGIRAIFNRGPAEKLPLDSNEVIREAIALIQNDLQSSHPRC